MMWREELLIKLGITWQMFKWVKLFLPERKIQVKVGEDYSGKYVIGNATPQGSIVSPLFFISDMFDEIERGWDDHYLLMMGLYGGEGEMKISGGNSHITSQIRTHRITHNTGK